MTPSSWREADAEALRSLHSIWIDAGRSDEHYLDMGAVAFRDEVAKAGVPGENVFFELFEGTHSNLEHRYVHGRQVAVAALDSGPTSLER